MIYGIGYLRSGMLININFLITLVLFGVVVAFGDSDFDEYPFHYLDNMIMNWVSGCYLFIILIDTHLIKFMIIHWVLIFL
jgi:hypothetical protein